MKGGAAGGGYAQVLPMDKINLHFTGDFHAITEANNMISALSDNYRFQHEAEGFKLKKILWRRVMDVNDRGLRRIITGIGDKNGIETESGFDITPASEIMAIMCFATSIDDLRRRIDNILLGITEDDKPFTVKDMGVGGSIVALLLDALKPNRFRQQRVHRHLFIAVLLPTLLMAAIPSWLLLLLLSMATMLLQRQDSVQISVQRSSMTSNAARQVCNRTSPFSLLPSRR